MWKLCSVLCNHLSFALLTTVEYKAFITRISSQLKMIWQGSKNGTDFWLIAVCCLNLLQNSETLLFHNRQQHSYSNLPSFYSWQQPYIFRIVNEKMSAVLNTLFQKACHFYNTTNIVMLIDKYIEVRGMWHNYCCNSWNCSGIDKYFV